MHNSKVVGLKPSGDRPTERSPPPLSPASVSLVQIQANHHVLAVLDLATSADFFVRVLGFRETFNDGNWSFVKRDNCMVMLGECPDAIPPRELGDHQYFAYLVVDDADAFHERCKAEGADLSSPLADKPWKMREFGVRTPDGHRIMIGQNLD